MQSIWSSTENFLPREPLKGDLTPPSSEAVWPGF